MPPLATQQPTIRPAVGTLRPRRAVVSPTMEGLALEQLTAKEIAYHGQIVGVDIPLILAPTGWGEYIVINAGPVQI